MPSVRPAAHRKDRQASADDLPSSSADVPHVTTRADRAGLRVEDVDRPPLKKRARLYRLDAQLRAALKLGKARCAKKTRRTKPKKGST
jgi:hypothetical protein